MHFYGLISWFWVFGLARTRVTISIQVYTLESPQHNTVSMPHTGRFQGGLRRAVNLDINVVSVIMAGRLDLLVQRC